MRLDGLLLVNKPKGMISKDVSRWLEKRIKFGKTDRIGHVGTLDPLASGVLPILLGRATRLQDSLLALPKTYEFTAQFGYETDSLDSDGQVVRRESFAPLADQSIRTCMTKLTGSISQIPPLFSAIKLKGRPLYEYARAGKGDQVELAEMARQVYVHEFDLLEISEDSLKLRARCSKGTYVRCLVRDLAASLGSVATMTALERTEASGFSLKHTYDLEAIEAGIGNGSFQELLVPVEKIDVGLPRWQASELETKRLRCGQSISMDLNQFSSGFTEKNTLDWLQGYAQPLWMLDSLGQAIGYGAVRVEQSERVVLCVKRAI